MNRETSLVLFLAGGTLPLAGRFAWRSKTTRVPLAGDALVHDGKLFPLGRNSTHASHSEMLLIEKRLSDSMEICKEYAVVSRFGVTFNNFQV